MSHSQLLTECFDPLPRELQGGILSIGNFDGVHSGHRRLLAKLRSRSRTLGVPAIVVSFEPHPFFILRPERAPIPLLWPQRKVELLHAAGADAVILYKTSRELLDLVAADFFREIVIGRLHARGMVEGPDFGFGKGRTGNVDSLAGMCVQAGITLDIAPVVDSAGAAVSSTRIRTLLTEGNVTGARQLLGRPHRIRGDVVVGDKRGRTLGFPTANLESILGFPPAEGVYAARTRIADKSHAVAVNVGPNPTFGIAERKVEAHILDFSGDLYGQALEIDFLDRLRNTRPFSGIEELKAQLAHDVTSARETWALNVGNEGSELALTIAEWLRNEVEPALATLGGEVERVHLNAEGVLRIEWGLPSVQLPADRFELLLQIEKRIRLVFPEVQIVESLAPGVGKE